MAIGDTVDRVRSQLDEETLVKIGAVLEEIRAEGNSLQDSLSAANSESKNRKIKIRELEGKLEDKDVEVIQLNKKVDEFDTTALEQERDSYKTKYQGFLNTQKDSFSSFYDKAKETSGWEKVQGEYTIPEEKEGKPEWEKLSEEDLETNVSRMAYHNSIEFFAVPETKPSPQTGKFFDGKPVPSMEEYAAIRTEYGVNSPQAKQANELIRKSKGV